MNRTFAIGALAVGLAAQASALSFRFQYESPLTNASGTLSVLASGPQIVNLPTGTLDGVAATGLTYTWTPGVGGAFTTGVGTLTSTLGSIDYAFLGNSSSTGMNGTVLSFNGGTGAFAGYVGSGIVSHTINSVDPNLVDGQFSASLQPVPEPASMLAFGVAGVALVRRRVRKATR